MPVYEYLCPSCLHKFEKIRCMADRHTILPCPNCRKLFPKMIISPVRGIVKDPAVPRSKK